MEDYIVPSSRTVYSGDLHRNKRRSSIVLLTQHRSNSTTMSSRTSLLITSPCHWLTTSIDPESDHKPTTIRDEVEQQQEHIQEKVEKQAENTKATETDSTFFLYTRVGT
jgi:hypothetical protein